MLRGRKKILEIQSQLFEEVFRRLFQNLSPEQISQSLKKEFADEPLRWISHKTIHQYVYAFPRGNLRGLFTNYLRSKRRFRKDRSHIHERRGSIKDAPPISERPSEVDKRKVPGYWEGDLIIGNPLTTLLRNSLDL